LLLIVALSNHRCEPGFGAKRFHSQSERAHSAERIYVSAVAATHNKAIRKLILLDQFQFGLPLNCKAIMLRANWR
jgi:hypothetical protein